MRVFNILIILFSVSLEFLSGQRIDTIYYDKNDHVVSPKKYDYYRVAKQENQIVKVIDYDKSGKIEMTGAFQSFDFKKEIGPFYYYTHGRLNQLEVYQPNEYPEICSKFDSILKKIPKQPDSLKLMVTFHKNNKINSIGYISNCCYAYGPWYTYAKNGGLMFMDTYSNNLLNGPYIMYISNAPYIVGEYKNNKKEGKWMFYNFDRKVRKIIFYRDGKKITILR
jgi:antitoxin component YwqK of YwqJK toxin-antitoxin module